MEDIRKFDKTKECPKCTNVYFTLEIQWIYDIIRTKYTCDDCNWKCTIDKLSNTETSTSRCLPYSGR